MREELFDVGVEGFGQFLQQLDRRISPTAFECAQIAARHMRTKRQCFLRNTPLSAQPLDIEASARMNIHRGKSATMFTLGRHTIVNIRH